MKIRLRKVAIYSAVGIAGLFASLTIFELWRESKGWCVRVHPDGKEEILYGDDCGENPVFSTQKGEH